MNKIKIVFFIGISALLISSCKEVGTVVDLGKNKPFGLLLDTAYLRSCASA
jgi:PBP1b-binding outer membrane lipoprotein LpoB